VLEVLCLASEDIDVVVVIATAVAAVLAGLDWVAADVDRVTGRRTGVHEMLEILRLATEAVDGVIVVVGHCL